MPRPGRKQGRYSQAARVLRMLEHLAAHKYGATIGDLAQEFSVSERQVRRDLDVIEEAGHRLEPIVLAERAGVRLERARPSAIQLTLGERYALLAARRVFDVLGGTPLHEDLRAIYDKVCASLPREHQTELERFGERFVYLPDGGTKIYQGREDALDALLTGVVRRWRVAYSYRSKANEVARGILEPYAMVLYKQGLYVIGHPLADGDGESVDESGSGGDIPSGPSTERTYAVERFTEAEFIRGAAFEVRAGFRVEDYFQGAFGIYRGTETRRVVIDFSERARPLVEARQWHPTQRMKRLARGGVRLALEVSDLTQVAQWIVGWGPLARVREPAELSERVAREHREAEALYA